MAVILLFDAENEARLFKRKIKDGCVTVEDKQFLIDEAEPVMLRSKMGGSYSPLYILKWDTLEPATNTNPSKFLEARQNMPKIKTKKLSPEFKDRYGMSPELFRKMMGMQILGNMIKPKKEFPNIILLIGGLIIGVLIMFAMVIFGVI